MTPSSSRNSITSASPRPIRRAAEHNVVTQISSHLSKLDFHTATAVVKVCTFTPPVFVLTRFKIKERSDLDLSCGCHTSEKFSDLAV